MSEALEQRFKALFQADAGAAYAALAARYGDPQRRYHNLNHIADCLQRLDETPAPNARAIELALWWHDAIYDPTRGDNEALSA